MVLIKAVIPGRPITKKNSQQLISAGGRPRVIPSRQYREYERNAGQALRRWSMARINEPVNVKAVYYMPTRGRVDLLNLLGATCDILVAYKVLEDDNSKIVVSHDGSRVDYDKTNPRVEIEISEAGNDG